MSPIVNSEYSGISQRGKKYESEIEKIKSKWTKFSENIIWTYLIYFVFFHIGFIAASASYILGLHSVPMKKLTLLWIFFCIWSGMLGVTAGAHRLWTHRSFKAITALKILLMIFYSQSGLYSLRIWIKDHRQHHKHTDTDLDPHDSRKGLFFSHWGWLFTKRKPECIRAGKETDIDDIRADPVVMFQDKHSYSTVVLFAFVLPTAIPVIFWGETVLHAVLTQCFIRYVYQLNIIFCVNSLAHYWGHRPYKRSISAVDNMILSLLVSGEATHNYHHTFPWDYKATEFSLINFNSTALFIRAMARLGLAYDLKEPSLELVEKMKRGNCDENLVCNEYND